jgi:quercetin dioxygenase-like cupin family protein
MKKIGKLEGTVYDPPKHFNTWSIRKLSDTDTTKKMLVSVSHFLPSGYVEMSGSATEKMYYVISGNVEVQTKDQTTTLGPGDIVYFAPDEERAMKVIGTDVCTIVVVMVKV